MSTAGMGEQNRSLAPFDPTQGTPLSGASVLPLSITDLMAERQLMIELYPLVIAGHGNTGWMRLRIVYTGNDHSPSIFTEDGAIVDRLLTNALTFLQGL